MHNSVKINPLQSPRTHLHLCLPVRQAGVKSLILLVYIMLAVSPAINAKDDKDLMKANYYYSHYAYSEAIPHLLKLSETAKMPDIFEKLGDCYRMTGNSEGAIEAYKKADETGKCKDATYLNYGLSLMRLGRYEQARQQLEKYKVAHPADRRAQNLIDGCSMAKTSTYESVGTIVQIAPFNSDGADFAPTLWKDNLVYTSDTVIDARKGTDKWSGNAYCSVYFISLSGKGKYGNEINNISGPKDLNIKFHTGPCTFGADDKEMYLTRSKYNGNFLARKAVSGKDSSVSLEVVIASDYDEKEKKFKTLTPFQYNNDNYSVAHPTVSPNGKLMVFSSDMPNGSGGRDLYLCRKTGTKTWTQPLNVGTAINTEGDEVFPWWVNDSTLYFSSNGLVGLGGLDVYKVNYNITTGTFSTPEDMPQPLNSSYDDISMAIAAGGNSGYFSSDRPADKKGDNIYYFRRTKVYLEISVIDSATGNPISAQIEISSPKGNLSGVTKATIPYLSQLIPEAQYLINVSKEHYHPLSFDLNAKGDENKEIDTIIRNIELSPINNSWDSMFAVTVTELPSKRREGIMDSAGISHFEVNKVYVIGQFDFNFSKFYYRTAQSNVNIEKKVVLDTLYNILMRYPTMQIQVQAHSDCRGSDEYNMKLSIDRAYSVVEYLMKRGIDRTRLEYKGFGETAPVVPCPDCVSCTEDEHAQNRVLEFKVLKI
jgi:outer membrane protein OmpA-like peptidoglycan-associated protein/tetratricopeptide (TPR) repeat protein